MTWDHRRKEMRASLTVIPAYPLTSIATSVETSFPCSSSDNRNYVCTDPDDDSPERPWNAGNELAIRLTFTPDESTTDPAPGTPHQVPGERGESLPVAYGARDTGYGWAVPQIAQDPDGVHVDGGTLYLLDAQDEHVYAFDLFSGFRQQFLEFDLDPQNTVGASWRGLTYVAGRWWVFNGDDYFSYAINGTDRRGPVDIGPSPQWIHAVDGDTIVYALPNAIGRLSVSDMGQGSTNPVVAGSQVNFPNTGNDDSGVSVDRGGRLWARQDSGIDDGGSVPGVLVYDWERYRHRNVLVREQKYDVPTYGSGGNSEPVDYAIAVSGNFLYTFFYDNGAVDDPATTDVDERYRMARYHIDQGLVFDPSAGFAQRPPTMGRVEPQDERTEGDAELVDVKFQWAHTSRIVEGHTVMEYRYSSLLTGESPVATVSASGNEYTIEALPRANYELLIEMRYRWYNNRESGHELIKNPPAATEQQCAAENTDEYPGNPPNGDGIDADEDADTTRPGCAFYIEPTETRYSNWAEVRVSVTGPLTGVPDVSMDIDPYTGLVAATADLLLVMGVEPDGIGPLSHTLTIIGWLILATAVAAAAYVVTGMKTGSAYLATFLWLAIWAGLGPFIAMIPWSMAYLPVAGLLLAGGTLALKRGRI